MTEPKDADSGKNNPDRDPSADAKRGNDENISPLDENTADEVASSDSPTPTSEAADSAGESSAAEDDELPEWEPLTPELVEDEAVRGDFVMRWAVVLLAMLLACTEIAQSSTLVHVKTGQYIADNGWQPPATDVFSYTANERSWVNLSWLFDLFAAGTFSVAGATGLTLAKALLAALALGLVVHTTKSGISTWWGSICAALAIIVCYPQFTALPEIVTILGIAATLWLLNRWSEGTTPNAIWALPVVFVFWSNLDPRMFLGLALLLLYAAGSSLGQMMGRDTRSMGANVSQLWMVTAACFVAAMLNPFGWNSLVAPLTLYGTEYPALQKFYAISTTQAPPTSDLQSYLQNYPLTSGVIWRWLNHHTVAGLMLIAATLVIFILNRKKLNLAHVFVYVGFLGFAVAGNHELAAASVVCCVLATLNAQEWYRENFRQTYSVETNELIFSRGGRAVTVLAMFVLAYLAINGRIGATENRRTGLGFHDSLQTSIDSLQSALADSYDDRPFNFVLSQGDVFIWSDQKSFVDNRVALFAGEGEEDLLAIHDFTRRSLRRPKMNPQQAIAAAKEESATPEPAAAQEQPAPFWNEIFDRYDVTHVVPRLSGASPDYTTYHDLLALDLLALKEVDNEKEWTLTYLGAAGAVFYRTNTGDPELKSYIDERKIKFFDLAFRSEPPVPDIRPEWAQPKSMYQKYFSLPSNATPNAIQESIHYYTHMMEAIRRGLITRRLGLALSHLAIRKANEGLAENPQSVAGYLVLGSVYELLGDVERQISEGAGGVGPRARRFYQAVHAYGQALEIDPDNPLTQSKLIQLYYLHQKRDLALRALKSFRELTSHFGVPTDEKIQQQQQHERLISELTDSTARVAAEVERRLSLGANRLAVSQFAYQQGCVLEALRILEEADNYVAQDLLVQRWRAIYLMEAGRSEKAWEALRLLEGVAEQSGYSEWRSPAAMAALANGDFPRAISLWNTEAEDLQSRRLIGLVRSLPLANPPQTWPSLQIQAAQAALYDLRSQSVEMLFNSALCLLETGENEQAAEALKKVLKIDPETAFRPLIRTYLTALTDETIELEPPTDWIPVETDMFASGEEEEEPKDKIGDDAEVKNETEAKSEDEAGGEEKDQSADKSDSSDGDKSE